MTNNTDPLKAFLKDVKNIEDGYYEVLLSDEEYIESCRENIPKLLRIIRRQHEALSVITEYDSSGDCECGKSKDISFDIATEALQDITNIANE